MKFYLALFCVVLTLIAGSSALPATNSLFKRNDEVCQCQVFIADFKGSSYGSYEKRNGGSKDVVGTMTFSQQENCTVVTGIFKSGFDGVKEEPIFTIKDHCGNDLYVLKDLDVDPTPDGGTKSFKQVYHDLKIDCGPDSIFAIDAKASCGGSGGSDYYSNQKRQAGGPSVAGNPPGASTALRPYP